MLQVIVFIAVVAAVVVIVAVAAVSAVDNERSTTTYATKHQLTTTDTLLL